MLKLKERKEDLVELEELINKLPESDLRKMIKFNVMYAQIELSRNQYYNNLICDIPALIYYHTNRSYNLKGCTDILGKIKVKAEETVNKIYCL